MKKISSFLFCLLLLAQLQAQYNRIYDFNMNDDVIWHGRVIECRDKGTVSTSYCEDASTGLEYALVSKVDEFGNPLWSHAIKPNDPSKERIFDTYGIVETREQGFLVVGYFQSDNETGGMEQPFVFGLDVNGNLQWSKHYRVNYNFAPNRMGKVSIIRAEDDIDETYIVVTSGCSDYRPGDNVIHAMKIDPNGTIIWTKKYYENDHLNNYQQRSDIPGDIAYDPASATYMITGAYHYDYLNSTHETFFMSLDGSGNFLGYLEVITPQTDWGHDMCYNEREGAFATTCTWNVTADCASTVIGLITVTPGLSLVNAKYYYDANHDENYGTSIFVDDEDHYIISGMVAPCGSASNGRPHFLKVNGWDLSTVFYHEYNVSTGHRVARGASTLCSPNTAGYEYLQAMSIGDILPPTAPFWSDSRLVRTNDAGEVCAYEKMSPIDVNAAEGTVNYDYFSEDLGEDLDYISEQFDIDAPYDPCGADDEKSAKLIRTSAEDTDIRIFPTTLESTSSVLQVKGAGLERCRIEIVSSTGQLLLNKKLSSEVNQFTMPELSAGIYFALVKDQFGEVVKMEKLSVR